MENIWKDFDKWYVISLINSNNDIIIRNFNRASIKNFEILHYKPANKVINIPKEESIINLLTHNNIDETSINIFENHIKTIQKAYDNKYKRVCILEDDAEFLFPIKKHIISNINIWMNSNKWDIFYFGHVPWPNVNSYKVTRNIVQPINPLLAHCYCLSRLGMYKILTSYYKLNSPMHIDNFFNKCNLNKYAIFPSISVQNKEPAIYNEITKRIGISTINYRIIFLILEYIAVYKLIFLLCVLFIIYMYKNTYVR